MTGRVMTMIAVLIAIPCFAQSNLLQITPPTCGRWSTDSGSTINTHIPPVLKRGTVTYVRGWWRPGAIGKASVALTASAS
jgi:hypothetical protein